MIRKVLKKTSSRSEKLDKFLDKYNLSREFFGVNRRSVTRGVWIGLFWGFIPMPMQMVAVVLSTFAFRFNIPIAIAMVWLSNPVTMPPMYYMEYLTGNFLLGQEGLDDIELTMEWFTENFDQILIPLYVGTSFYSVIVSTLIYFLVNWLWIKSVHEEKRGRKAKHQRKIKELLKRKAPKNDPIEEERETKES
ncbi:MAG: DUF2062 domain-containing protein [Campylobacterales bacterium]|nr:DUF2062 domain-containing protein [Campylobacterales bacterium]